uniref:Uncharacterized protein n=1 Tax=Meloidogyne hapla TaxID=6305 RepID=A0A1I8BYI7_MELHA
MGYDELFAKKELNIRLLKNEKDEEDARVEGEE